MKLNYKRIDLLNVEQLQKIGMETFTEVMILAFVSIKNERLNQI